MKFFFSQIMLQTFKEKRDIPPQKAYILDMKILKKIPTVRVHLKNHGFIKFVQDATSNVSSTQSYKKWRIIT